MTDIKYDESKGSDKCTVTTDGGEVVRATNVNSVSGEVIYDKSKGSTQCTVVTEDGKTVRAMNVVNLGEGGGGGVDKSQVVNKADVMPVADSTTAGQVYMYTGETDSTYTHGYIYENVPTTTSSSATATQTVGATLSDIAVDVETLESFTGWTTDNSLQIFYTADGWSVDTTSLGVTYTGTPNVGDAITITYTAAVTTYSWTRVDVQPNSGGAVSSVNGETGDVVLNAKKVNAVPQYETMPTASAGNVGEVVQYSGETIPGVEESATILQTVGSGLTSLSVNLETFVGAEQPTGNETVDFVALDEGAAASITQNPDGETVTIINADLFVNWIEQRMAYLGLDINDWLTGCIHWNGVEWYLFDINMQSNIGGGDSTFWEGIGVEIVGAPTGSSVDAVYEITSLGGISWTKNSQTVDLSGYGISYSGTPNNGDTLTVAYTAPVAGITNGYFYKNSAKYGDPSATISQTVGSGLTDLVVDVDTFIEAEQPTQDEQVEFVSAGSVRTMSQTSGTSGDISLSITNVEDFLTEIGSLDDVYIGAGSVITTIYATGNGDDRAYQISIEYTANGTNYTRWDLPADQYSVVVSGTSPAGTLMRPIENATVLSEDSWTKDNESVDIAAYGVSYSGSPTTGDVLTVAYTAPAPIGYYWEQTNVQPSSGGGNASIEWKTKVDLPAEYTGNEWGVAAYFTIAGGLPDGEYEFYYSVKSKIGPDYPEGERIYKIKLVLDNNTNYALGQLGYVFNGDYMNNSNRADCLVTRQVYNTIMKNNSDLVFYPKEFLNTDILAYNNHQYVAECFKLSAIKNVTTGEEYIATGAINLDGSEPQYTLMFGGDLSLAQLGQQPYIPSRAAVSSYSVTDFASSTIKFTKNGSAYFVINMSHTESNSQFVAEYIGKSNSQNIEPYAQKIIKATGIFANCYLATDTNSVWVMGVDTVTAATLTGSVSVMIGVISTADASFLIEPLPQSTTPIAQIGAQGYRLGDIAADGIGNIIQYTGETNVNYTNGYFYKATGTVVTVPASIAITTTDPEVSVSIDVEDWINAMSATYGWTKSQIEQWLYDYRNDQFNMEADYDNNTALSLYVPWMGVITDQSILQYIHVTSSYTGTAYVYFTQSYTPESTSVQNASWERVNTQPLDLTGITGYDATKTQVLKNVQGTLTWVDE